MLVAFFAAVVIPTAIALITASALGRRARVVDGDLDSDSVSFAGGVLSALYTVVLAFYLVFAWQLGADVESASTAEADALVDAYWQAVQLPTPAAVRIQGLVREYSVTVADREWDLLKEDRAEPRVSAIISELRSAFSALPTGDDRIDLARQQGLQDVRQIDEQHRKRVDAASGDTFTRVLLLGTIVTAILMIAFPLLTGLSPHPVNLTVLAVLTVTVGMSVFLSLQMAHPLRGPFAAEPDAFRSVLDQMRPVT